MAQQDPRMPQKDAPQALEEKRGGQRDNHQNRRDEQRGHKEVKREDKRD